MVANGMKRSLVALLVASLAAATDLVDGDPDSDPASFMIVVEHEDGYRCAGSLVSIRTGVTTAACARGRGAGAAVWALAAALAGARPAAPPGAGARRVSRAAFAGDGRDPADPALDVALLELEAPFGGEARARPILMATAREACGAPCHAVRALPAGARRVRLRVVGLRAAPDARCAARVPHWAAVRARAMCLTGDTLCERDLGGGVVCGGKLCGVLSAAAGPAAGRGPARCGDTLAAQVVAQWRRFLHCAYTIHHCGSDTCAGQCTERKLLEEPRNSSTRFVAATEETTEPITRLTVTESPFGWSDSLPVTASEQQSPTRTLIHINKKIVTISPPPTPPPSPELMYSPRSFSSPRPSRTTTSRVTVSSSLSLFEASVESQPVSFRSALEFEPNRPDFKAAPIQPTPVRLKAGEYGDNAAEYGGEEAPPAGGPAGPAGPPASRPPERLRPPDLLPPSSSPPPDAPPAPALMAPVSLAPAASLSSRPTTPWASILLLCIVMNFLKYSRNKKVQYL